jgi:hypothetical protein
LVPAVLLAHPLVERLLLEHIVQQLGVLHHLLAEQVLAETLTLQVALEFLHQAAVLLVCGAMAETRAQPTVCQVTQEVVEALQQETYQEAVFSALVVNINQLQQLFFQPAVLFLRQLILLALAAEAQILPLVLTAAAVALAVTADSPAAAAVVVETAARVL